MRRLRMVLTYEDDALERAKWIVQDTIYILDDVETTPHEGYSNAELLGALAQRRVFKFACSLVDLDLLAGDTHLDRGSAADLAKLLQQKRT
jgi:hypothetical protein